MSRQEEIRDMTRIQKMLEGGGSLEQIFTDALAQDEFQLYYQPKIDLTTGKLSGAEALLRWLPVEGGIVSPADFIPAAEESGMIVPIGEWVIRTACQQLKKWQAEGTHTFRVSVNISIPQLHHPDFIKNLRVILEETGVDPSYLELEITESVMADIDYIYMILRELKDIGVQISLDDFGTGFSSLQYLKNLPIDKLKIDRSFIRNCTVDSSDATLVRTIITMSHQLGYRVVAEGVESKEQLTFLQRNLCDAAQGFLFSRPVPAPQFHQQAEQIPEKVQRYGLSIAISSKPLVREEVRRVRQELINTVRQQQGMIFKFIKRNGVFIHTMCDGELLYRSGLTPEDVVGRELSDFLPADLAEDKLQSYENAWNKVKDVTYELEKDGLHYLTSLRPIQRGGQVIEVIGSSIDITERKKAEESLRINEANYRFIIENISDLVKIVDVDGVIEYASPSHRETLGSSPDLYLSRLFWEVIHEEDQEVVTKAFSKMIKEKRTARATYRHQHSEGSYIRVESVGTPVIDNRGEVTRAVVVTRVCTDN